MVLIVFQSLEARATKPDTGANEYNHALRGIATASGSNFPALPNNAIDDNPATYWQSSTTTGWLAVRFASMVRVNEIHIHFLTTVYSRLSLYLDTSGNGAYESGEKVWSTTSNTGLDVIRVTTTSYTLGMKVTIDARNGNDKPKIAEFEAYLRYDTDGDGLTNDQEATTYFYQQADLEAPPSSLRTTPRTQPPSRPLCSPGRGFCSRH